MLRAKLGKKYALLCGSALLLALGNLMGFSTGLPAEAQTQGLSGTSAGIPKLEQALSARPLPLNPERLNGLSSGFVLGRYREYQNTVRAYNRSLKISELGPRSAVSTRLFNHQYLLYHALLALGGDGLISPASLPERLLQREGHTLSSWQAEVATLGTYLSGGTGWIIWGYNLLTRQTELYPAQDDTDLRLGSIPLVVLDLRYSTYQADFGDDEKTYLQTLLKNLNWDHIGQQAQQLGLDRI